MGGGPDAQLPECRLTSIAIPSASYGGGGRGYRSLSEPKAFHVEYWRAWESQQETGPPGFIRGETQLAAWLLYLQEEETLHQSRIKFPGSGGECFGG